MGCKGVSGGKKGRGGLEVSRGPERWRMMRTGPSLLPIVATSHGATRPST